MAIPGKFANYLWDIRKNLEHAESVEVDFDVFFDLLSGDDRKYMQLDFIEDSARLAGMYAAPIAEHGVGVRKVTFTLKPVMDIPKGHLIGADDGSMTSPKEPDCQCSVCAMLRSTICRETTRFDWPEPAMFFFKRVDVGRYELAIDKSEYDIRINRERETEDEVVIELIAKPRASE